MARSGHSPFRHRRVGSARLSESIRLGGRVMRKSLVVLGILALLLTIGQPAAEAINTDLSHGSFSVTCFYTHSAHDDPIVFPGSAGASHIHNFYGNQSANAFSTVSSMQASTTKCRFQDDKAGYWTPAR